MFDIERSFSRSRKRMRGRPNAAAALAREIGEWTWYGHPASLVASLRNRCAAARRLFQYALRPRGCPCSREQISERSIRYGGSQGAGAQLLGFIHRFSENDVFAYQAGDAGLDPLG